MRRSALLLAIVLGGALLAARPAQARLIDLYAGATAGGMAGWGTTPNTPDFFDTTRGGGVGFNLGLKLLVFDFSTNFFQTFNGSGAAGTLVQFLLGTEIDIPLGEAKLPDGQSQNVLEPEIAGGFGFGTPGPGQPAAQRQPGFSEGGRRQRHRRLRVLLQPLHRHRREGDLRLPLLLRRRRGEFELRPGPLVGLPGEPASER